MNLQIPPIPRDFVLSGAFCMQPRVWFSRKLRIKRRCSKSTHWTVTISTRIRTVALENLRKLYKLSHELWPPNQLNDAAPKNNVGCHRNLARAYSQYKDMWSIVGGQSDSCQWHCLEGTRKKETLELLAKAKVVPLGSIEYQRLQFKVTHSTWVDRKKHHIGIDEKLATALGIGSFYRLFWFIR